MWFKAASLFSLQSPFKLTPEDLHDQLSELAFTPCSKRQLDSYGWVAPMGHGSDQLVHASSGFMLLKARREERILPASVIAEHMAERIEQMEQKLDRKIRGREKLEVRDNIVMELTPQAFTRSSYEQILIMPEQMLMVVDNASNKKVDQCTALLRESLGSLHIKPVQTNTDPGQLYTRWLKGTRKLPADLVMGDECVLQDEDNIAGYVRCNKQDLSSEEIRALSKTGKQVIRIAIESNGTVSFVIDNECILSKIKFIETVEEGESDFSDLDERSVFDANMTLMALEFSTLFPRIIEVLGGLAEDEV